MEKILYILSSKSGKTEFDIGKNDLKKLYKNRKNDVKIIETNYKNHAKNATYDFIKSNKDVKKAIIVAGGDGSLNEIAEIIYKYDRNNSSLGLIPMGTANDFSKNFSYKNFSINSLLNFKNKKIDLIKVNNSICINVLSLGFDTIVLENAYKILDKNPNLGKKAYLLGVLKSIPKISYKDLYLKLEDDKGNMLKFNDKFLLSAICNGGFYGSGFNPAPSAKVDDGVLNLVYAKKIPTLLLPSLIVRYKYGKLENSKYLKEIKVKKGLIKAKEDILANIDGEIFKSNNIEFEIIEKAINWIYFN
ncbi:YegS/Rv2252/BmrU family lipid kinase [Anaerococcus sp. AGMB00486]|uniref:YegS/Rv2252/BmrU family lipid kinase n=1 Tax=Anaerococcus faecalis TaxID=2742993 RepID=A0ABX2N8H8_9FIRM|nr:YegS/Rv2252/BmrU family lipid kinase [Anaerococcus faecalis]NVF10988.1 YegS/Rv2252/BmrU family lipid kinase [Anaerococcus faecalis]